MGNTTSIYNSGEEEQKNYDVVCTSIELGSMIIDLLDLKDKINLYKVKELRKLFAPRHAKSVILSRTSLGTADTLHTDFIIQMGSHIQELNLSYVKDLTPDIFIQTLNQLENLRILDVTYTSVFLHHLVETGIPKNLENLSINFNPPGDSIHYDAWFYCNCQNLKKIHFIAFQCADLEKSYEFFRVIPVTNGLQVKITIIRDSSDDSDYLDEQTQPHLSDTNMYFKELTFIMLNSVNLRHLNGIRGLDFNQLEYIFMMNSEQAEIIIYTSPLLRPLFTGNVGRHIQIKVCQKLPHFYACSKFIVKIWNKDLTTFDAEFFKKVLEEMKEYFPQYICMHSDSPEFISIVKAESDWYCIDVNVESNVGFEKKLQYLPTKITLTSTCKKDNTYRHNDAHILSLSPELSLKNITFLALSDIDCYTDNFFVVLLQHCKLQTLDLLGSPLPLGLDKAIQFANNLNNYRQDNDNPDYELIFATLSRCPTLKNIHICDSGEAVKIEKSKITNITIHLISIIANCKDIYSIFIDSDFARINLNPVHSCLTHLAYNHTSVVFSQFHLSNNPFADVFEASELFENVYYM